MVTLKRVNGDVVEQFEMPDSPYKEAVEIYKMEYEKAAQRYNDLYNAAWTNFSYMALVAGGLLTFGGARFVTPLTAFLACLPLLFWWIATFEPLNRYGDKVQGELEKIEKALTPLCISHDFPLDAQKGLTHFSDFAKRGQRESAVLDKIWRVRYVVRGAAGMLLLLTLGFGFKVGGLIIKGDRLTVVAEPLAVVVTSSTPNPTPSATPAATTGNAPSPHPPTKSGRRNK